MGAGRQKGENPCKEQEVNDMEALHAKDLSTAQALVALNAGIEKAKEIDTKMNIAVVDAGCNLKAFVRMDGAWLGSIDIALKKARTARFFDMPTGEIGKLSMVRGRTTAPMGMTLGH